MDCVLLPGGGGPGSAAGGAADGDQGGTADGDLGGTADGDAGRAADGDPGGAADGGGTADGDPGGAADGDADAGFGHGAGMDHNSTYDDDSYLRNPAPENEHVGTDEENLYEPLDMVLVSDKEKDKDYVADHESGEESDDESEEDQTEIEEEEEEEEEHYEANHAPNVEYDKEDPPMTEGSTYPNMEEFKLALSQHAVKHGFEYNTEKSTPRRFRGYCKRREDDNCPWRIHASTTDDMCTVVVKKNPCDHDCSSAKLKKKVKNATKFWVCEKVKDWLIEDATFVFNCCHTCINVDQEPAQINRNNFPSSFLWLAMKQTFL